MGLEPRPRHVLQVPHIIQLLPGLRMTGFDCKLLFTVTDPQACRKAVWPGSQQVNDPGSLGGSLVSFLSLSCLLSLDGYIPLLCLMQSHPFGETNDKSTSG
jgi:hypothetical protein